MCTTRLNARLRDHLTAERELERRRADDDDVSAAEAELDRSRQGLRTALDRMGGCGGGCVSPALVNAARAYLDAGRDARPSPTGDAGGYPAPDDRAAARLNLEAALRGADVELTVGGRCRAAKARRRKQVLIAVDDSAPSEWAVRAGGQLAESLDADVTLLHVVAPAAAVVDDFVATQRLDAAMREEGRELLARMRLLLPAGVEPGLATRQGAAGDEIVRAARDGRSDLVVVGTRGRGRLARFLLGGTAEWVVRHAPCPVLTVGHAPAPAPSPVVSGFDTTPPGASALAAAHAAGAAY